MIFGRALYFLTYATALWSFLMLWVFAELSPISAVVYIAAFLLCLYNDKRRIVIPQRLWLFISLGALSLALYGWFGLRIYFDSVANLFLYLEINKLFTARSHRDVLQIYGLTFFKALAASVSTASVLFAPALLIYIFLIVAAMITITVRHDAELALQSAKGKKERAAGMAVRMESRSMGRFRELQSMQWLTTRLIRRLIAAIAFIVTAGMALFFIIPRLQGQAVNIGLAAPATGRQTAGFSDSINFSGMGEIQQNPAIAMRAIPGQGFRIDGNGYPSDPLLRLRGTSLDYFDGRTWSKSEVVQRRLRTTERRRAAEFSLQRAFRSNEGTYRMRIQMEPSSKGYLFGPDRPASYSFEQDQVLLLDDVSGSVQVLNPSWSGPLAYQVEARTEDPNWRTQPSELDPNIPTIITDSGNLIYDPRAVRRRVQGPGASRRFENFEEVFLQLPDIPDMAVVRSLSTEWLTGIDGNFEKARRLEHRLRNYFSYTVENDFSARPDHLAYFLTEAKEGHCEYFATAMVLMLRANGIPARVVNGFATDEWVAASSGYYLVRQEHAHSWVEAWFPEGGWITFDPTPASGIGNQRLPNTVYRRLTRWFDMVKFQWYDKVIDYDARDQAGMMFALFRGLESASAYGGTFSRVMLGEGTSNTGFAQAFVLVLLLAGGGVAFLLYTRQRKVRRIRVERAGETIYPRAAPIEDYRELLERLHEVVPRAPSVTPLEYARTVASQKSALADFLPLTERYYSSRYNGSEWSASEANRSRALLRLVEAASERAGKS